MEVAPATEEEDLNDVLIGEETANQPTPLDPSIKTEEISEQVPVLTNEDSKSLEPVTAVVQNVVKSTEQEGNCYWYVVDVNCYKFYLFLFKHAIFFPVAKIGT